MSKIFSVFLIVAGCALGAAGLVHAQSADGPSYPSLDPIRSTASRALVQAAARDEIQGGAANGFSESADGPWHRTPQTVGRGQRSRAEVSAEVSRQNGPAIVIASDDR